MIRKKHALALALAACTFVPFSHAGDLNFSGFLSVGGGIVDDEDSISYAGYSEEDLTFDKNLLGLQVSGQVADKLTATAQMIARSGSDYDVTSEWAYLTYQLTDNSKIRAGRLRTPFYQYSDFVDVGYSYAWITPPDSVYYLPFNNMDGIDFYTTGTLGKFDTSLQAYFGGFTGDFSSDGTMLETKSRNQMGLAVTLGRDWWTLRAAYHQNDLTISAENIALDETTTIGDFADTLRAFNFNDNADMLLSTDDKASFFQIGGTIDTGKFVLAAEHIEFDVDTSLFSKDVREYVMAGVRAGDWLFHVTGSKAKDEATDLSAGIPANVALPVVGSTNLLIGTLNAVAESQVEDRDVLSLGARWDFTTGAAFKIQLDDVDDQAGDQKVLSVAVQTVF